MDSVQDYLVFFASFLILSICQCAQTFLKLKQNLSIKSHLYTYK